MSQLQVIEPGSLLLFANRDHLAIGRERERMDRCRAQLHGLQALAGGDVVEPDFAREAPRRQPRAVGPKRHAEHVDGRHVDLPARPVLFQVTDPEALDHPPPGRIEDNPAPAMRSPSGEIAKSRSDLSWLGASAIKSMARTCRPVSASQNRMIPSFWAVTAALPSRVKSIPATPLVWRLWIVPSRVITPKGSGSPKRSRRRGRGDPSVGCNQCAPEVPGRHDRVGHQHGSGQGGGPESQRENLGRHAADPPQEHDLECLPGQRCRRPRDQAKLGAAQDSRHSRPNGRPQQGGRHRRPGGRRRQTGRQHARGWSQATARQAMTQQVFGPGQPARHRPLGPSQRPGGLLLRLTLQIAEHHRQPILVRQPAQLFIEDRVHVGRCRVTIDGGNEPFRGDRARPCRVGPRRPSDARSAARLRAARDPMNPACGSRATSRPAP